MKEGAIALREWAVAVKALEEGQQIMVLRKGGIAEETREFKLESPRFYLFPSFEHQKPDLVKPEARGMLDDTMHTAASQSDVVRITSYAEVTQDIELLDAEALHRLEKLHIWTEDYAEERLKWRRTKPLHVLILRVYKLETPMQIPFRESYSGCKSWLWLEEASPIPMKPVMDDEEYADRVSVIHQRLKG